MSESTMTTIADGGVVPRPSAAEVVAAYLVSADVSLSTRTTYARALGVYSGWIDGGSRQILSIRRSDLVEYKHFLMVDRHLAPRTVNLYLAAVRGLHRWAEAERIVPDPTRGLRDLPTGPSDRTALTLEEARSLLAVPAEGPAGLRDRAIVSLMTRRGLRCCEVARARVGDLATVGGVRVLRVRGKGRAAAAEYVVLGAAAADVDAWLSARGPAGSDDPLFVGLGNRQRGGPITTRTVERAVSAALAAAGVTGPGVSAHSLRHTAVTLALAAGADVREVQAMARHRRIDTTIGYAHDLERIRGVPEAAVDSLLDEEK